MPFSPVFVALFPRFKACLGSLIPQLSFVEPPRFNHDQVSHLFSLHRHLLQKRVMSTQGLLVLLLTYLVFRACICRINSMVRLISSGVMLPLDGCGAAGLNNISLQQGFHASVFEMACLLERRALVVVADGSVGAGFEEFGQDRGVAEIDSGSIH